MMMMSSSALESIVPDSSQSASFHCYFVYFLVSMTSHNIGFHLFMVTESFQEQETQDDLLENSLIPAFSSQMSLLLFFSS